MFVGLFKAILSISAVSAVVNRFGSFARFQNPLTRHTKPGIFRRGRGLARQQIFDRDSVLCQSSHFPGPSLSHIALPAYDYISPNQTVSSPEYYTPEIRKVKEYTPYYFVWLNLLPYAVRNTTSRLPYRFNNRRELDPDFRGSSQVRGGPTEHTTLFHCTRPISTVRAQAERSVGQKPLTGVCCGSRHKRATMVANQLSSGECTASVNAESDVHTSSTDGTIRWSSGGPLLVALHSHDSSADDEDQLSDDMERSPDVSLLLQLQWGGLRVSLNRDPQGKISHAFCFHASWACKVYIVRTFEFARVDLPLCPNAVGYLHRCTAYIICDSFAVEPVSRLLERLRVSCNKATIRSASGAKKQRKIANRRDVHLQEKNYRFFPVRSVSLSEEESSTFLVFLRFIYSVM